MLRPGPDVQVYLYADPVDMRNIRRQLAWPVRDN